MAIDSVDDEAAEPLVATDGPISNLKLRPYYIAPTQAADWDEDYDERAASWWELFVDLIIVVAWTNVTDALYESELGSVRAMLLFILTMNIIQCAWNQYLQYTTRFVDESLSHSLVLFFMILGLAGMALHVGDPEFATEFTVSMLLQKLALIAMYACATYHSKRARTQMGLSLGVLCFSAAICVAIICTQPDHYTAFAVTGWLFIVVLELSATPGSGMVLSREARLPINIDHLVDRHNAYIMVALGESLLSGMIHYAATPSAVRVSIKARFYGCMALVLLMAFSIGLMYYNVQPPRHASAFRRSQNRGFLVYYAHLALATAILLVGVGVKYAMHATMHSDGKLSAGRAWLLICSVALTLHLIFWMRLGHYWGIEPTESDSRKVKGVKYRWWAVVGLWPLFVLMVTQLLLSRGDMSSWWTLALAAGACSGLVVVETGFTSWLAAEEKHGSSDEQPIDIIYRWPWQWP